MKIIIGLGNPGEKYEKNRHNVGFILAECLKNEWEFSDFEFSKKFNAEVSEGNLDEEKIIIAKPLTFMNKSGEAVQQILSFYKLAPKNLVIIHDDLDIEIGNYKISNDSSAAGHNGAQDIFKKMGTQKIKRIRIGVEVDGGRQNRKIPGEAFVLQDFTEEEYEKVKAIINEIAGEIIK